MASAAVASGGGLQNIQDRRRVPAFEPNSGVWLEIFQPLGGCEKLRVVNATFAALAFAVFGNDVAEGVRAEMRHLAKERDRRLLVSVFQLAIRRAHAAERLNPASVAN